MIYNEIKNIRSSISGAEGFNNATVVKRILDAILELDLSHANESTSILRYNNSELYVELKSKNGFCCDFVIRVWYENILGTDNRLSFLIGNSDDMFESDTVYNAEDIDHYLSIVQQYLSNEIIENGFYRKNKLIKIEYVLVFKDSSGKMNKVADTYKRNASCFFEKLEKRTKVFQPWVHSSV